jgi:hypothetical protein
VDPKAKRKINSIIAETQSIIRELEDISNGINREFKGIGSDKCANGLHKTADKYRNVIQTLRNI